MALTEAPSEILQEKKREEGECRQTFSFSSLSSLTSAGKSGEGTVPKQQSGLSGWKEVVFTISILLKNAVPIIKQ